MSEGRELSTFEQKLAKRRAAQEEIARGRQKLQQMEIDERLIPDDKPTRSEQDLEIDRVLDAVDILDAYRIWCGKMTPDPKGKTESIMISCPIPNHPDKKPSAWINTDKQTWFCAGCQVGGDKYDIAAYRHGYPVPGYKEGSNFRDLRKDMAADLGYTFTTLPGDVTIVTGPPEPVGTVATPEPETEPEEPVVEGKVVELFDDEDEEDNLEFFDLPWRDIIPADTYLEAYMSATTLDDVPEEFHFWNGLLGLGFALGREVTLVDFVPVYGNLFVCTLGRSGSGKSKARSHLNRLLSAALPHDWSDPNSKGVRKITAPGSGESLIHNFQKPVQDPSDPKRIAFYAPVRGMIDFNELSALVGRTGRTGSVIVPTLMQFYDMEDIIGTSSMTHGAKEAHYPFASALTTTQPAALKNLLSKADDSSGFLNRWIFAPGTKKRRFAIGGVQVNMDPVAPKLQRIAGWAGSFKAGEQIQWSTEAAARFTTFFHEVIEPDKERSNTDLLVRTDLLVKKLILLFAANRMEKEVSLQTVEDAIACYPYITSAYAITGKSIGTNLQTEVANAVQSLLERKGKALTLSQIARSFRRKDYPHDLLLKTVDNLVKLGFIEVEKTREGSVGRPATRYKNVS